MFIAWKRLFDANFHEWKIIPFFLVEKYFRKIFKFHDSLDIPQYHIKKMPEFFAPKSNDPSVLWLVYLYVLIKYIKIGNKRVYFSDYSNHGINFIGNLVDINGKYKSWDTLKYECNLTEKFFWWLQLVHEIPKFWVEALNKDLGVSVNLAIYDHNLIKNCQSCALDKLLSKELYNISLCSMYQKPTSQSHFEKY